MIRMDICMATSNGSRDDREEQPIPITMPPCTNRSTQQERCIKVLDERHLASAKSIGQWRLSLY